MESGHAPQDVPLRDLSVLLHGFVSKAGLGFVAAGLPRTWPATARALFVGYSDADLPVGTTFDLAFPHGRPERAVRTRAVLHAVTQQFAKPLAGVPRGWKTICLIDFPDGCPEPIEALSTVDGWISRLEDCACLSGAGTVEALLAERA
jgi:hypothetical protein